MFFNDSRIQEPGCAPNGLLDVSSCIRGATQLYFSQPHFQRCAKELRRNLIGIREARKDEISYIKIEKRTGATVKAQHLMQINLGLVNGNLT
jgi:hypothetical protein